MAPQYKVELPEGRAALESALKALTDRITDPTVRAHYASYFRKLLWQRSPERPRPAAERSAAVTHMATQERASELDVLVHRMLNVILKYPSFLNKSNTEEALSRFDILNPRIDALRNAVVHAASSADIHDSDAFAAAVRQQLAGIPLETLRLSYIEGLGLEDATYIWNQTLATYEVEHLKFEAKALENSLGQSMDESVQSRLFEVQDALHKAQARRTFAPAEADII
jgi:hypothetical protein